MIREKKNNEDFPNAVALREVEYVRDGQCREVDEERIAFLIEENEDREAMEMYKRNVKDKSLIHKEIVALMIRFPSEPREGENWFIAFSSCSCLGFLVHLP